MQETPTTPVGEYDVLLQPKRPKKLHSVHVSTPGSLVSWGWLDEANVNLKGLIMTTPYDRLMADVRDGRVVLIDGATGTEIERRGAVMHGKAWCAAASLTHPDVLLDVHRDYIKAGARVITTNTFSTNRNMLEPAGLGPDFEILNRKAVELALAAREAEAAQQSVVVAGSLSHQIPFQTNSKGKVIKRTAPPLELAEANFNEMASTLAASGVDLLLLEMMSTPVLANLALNAARATGLPLWVGFSIDSGPDGTLISHATQELSADQMLNAVDFSGADAIGIMHSQVNILSECIALLRRHFGGPIMAYPDSGYFVMPNWQFDSVIGTKELCAYAEQWMRDGAQIIGGCCGVGTEHIEALAETIN